MAIRKLTNAAYLATNWQDEVESKNDLKKGLCIVELDTTNKQIKAGSVIEANGVIYKSDTATSPSNSVTNDAEYFIYFRDISGTLDFYYSTEVPSFNYIKNGWYGSTNTTWRAIAQVYLNTTWISINIEKDFTKDYYTSTEMQNIITTFIIDKLNKKSIYVGATGTVWTSADYTTRIYNTQLSALTYYSIDDTKTLFNNLITKINSMTINVPSLGTFIVNPIDTTNLWQTLTPTVFPSQLWTKEKIKDIFEKLIVKTSAMTVTVTGTGLHNLSNIDNTGLW